MFFLHLHNSAEHSYGSSTPSTHSTESKCSENSIKKVESDKYVV